MAGGDSGSASHPCQSVVDSPWSARVGPPSKRMTFAVVILPNGVMGPGCAWPITGPVNRFRWHEPVYPRGATMNHAIVLLACCPFADCAQRYSSDPRRTSASSFRTSASASAPAPCLSQRISSSPCNILRGDKSSTHPINSRDGIHHLAPHWHRNRRRSHHRSRKTRSLNQLPTPPRRVWDKLGDRLARLSSIAALPGGLQRLRIPYGVPLLVFSGGGRRRVGRPGRRCRRRGSRRRRG